MDTGRCAVEAVLFDLGGTLIKTSEIPAVLKRILQHQGISRSLEEISLAWDVAEKKFDFQELTALLEEFWVRLNSYVLTQLNVMSDRRELAEFIATRWWDFSEVTLYSDARTVLPALKERGLKMGVVTNGLQSDVAQILPKIGLQNFFNVVVAIDTLERMKPDVAVFRYALQRLKVPASRTVFVGDEVEADYIGSRKAGLTAYLIDRERKSAQGFNRISSLTDLIEYNLI